jgi:perosamine synthetase
MSTTALSYDQYMARIGAEKVPCYEPWLGQEELLLLTEVVESGWLSEHRFTRRFEQLLAERCGRQHALAFNNATAAMIAGMKALGLGPGDEVIVPSFTHSADPNAIAAVGAEPVFAEVDAHTLCLSVETVQAAMTPRTRGILHVALYGSCANLPALEGFARQRRLFLINDCAAALGSRCGHVPITAYGDFSVLSFFADKTITTGEGGMLLADDAALLSECGLYKHDGRRERGTDLIERRGYNFRMTEMQAAVGVAQLGKLDSFVSRKKEIVALYASLLADLPDVAPFRFPAHCEPVPHRAVVFSPDAPELARHLARCDVGVRRTFMPMHSQPCYGKSLRFPVTERLYATGLCLPSAPKLTDSHVQQVCAAIRSYYGEKP